MRVTVLGCGASSGVPLIGCLCAVCTSQNPKNRRSRVSVLVETDNTRILIDTSPDLREQCLRHGINKVDAILYTHDHADHTHGIDDVRSFNFHKGGPIRAYMNQRTLEGMKQRFNYAFKAPVEEYGWFRPALDAQLIEPGKPFTVNKIPVIPFLQHHGGVDSLGFRIGDFAYSTDVKELPEKSFNSLLGIKLWIVDCLKYTPAPTHAHLELTLEWIKRVKPGRAYLTHMTHEFDYDRLAAELPPGVEPAYDGLTVELS